MLVRLSWTLPWHHFISENVKWTCDCSSAISASRMFASAVRWTSPVVLHLWVSLWSHLSNINKNDSAKKNASSETEKYCKFCECRTHSCSFMKICFSFIHFFALKRICCCICAVNILPCFLSQKLLRVWNFCDTTFKIPSLGRAAQEAPNIDIELLTSP